MIPVISPTKVEALFITKTVMRTDHKTRTLQVVSCQKIIHCALVFTMNTKKWIVLINRKRGMFLVPWDRWQWIQTTGKYKAEYITVDMGTAPVSLALMASIIDRPEWRVSSFVANLFWWLIGRWFSKTYQPLTCCLTICYLLRMCGYKVKLHIEPHKLYKELKDGVNNHFWNSQGGKNHLGKTVSKRGL